MVQRGRLTSTERRKKRERLHYLQSGLCFWCGSYTEPSDATIDELKARSKGGTQRWGNVVMSCQPCNEHRANFRPPDWAHDRVASMERVRSALNTIEQVLD